MKRRILVTGGAGFIGSHVVEALLANGDEPHALDDLSKGQISNLPRTVPLHVVDIARGNLHRIFADARYDAVVHCAAQTNVMRSLAEPELDARINVDGLRRVLEAAEATGVRRFVFVSSGGAIYGETPVPATEATAPRPDNPYGANKVEGERIVDASRISSVVLRPSNVYGARQRSDAEGGVVSIFCDRVTAGLPLHVYGDGQQERDFVHVIDVAAAILLALRARDMTGAWNVATGRATSINELVRVMESAFGRELSVERLPERQEIRRSCLDVGKLTATGQWTPSIDLSAGIAQLAVAEQVAAR